MSGLLEHRLKRVAAAEGDDGLAPIGELVLSDGSGTPRQRTRVRAGDDGVALRVRFDCEDDDPWSTHACRDAPLWEEEVVEVFLAPGAGRPRVYFEFEINPGGALFDARIESPEGRRETMSVDAGWNAPGVVWSAAIQPEGNGWWARLVLPWAALGDNAAEIEVWRANFYRIDRPRSAANAAEFSAWAPTHARPADFHLPAFFGRLLRPARVR